MKWEKCAHAKQCVLSKYVVVEGFKKYLTKLLNENYAIPHFKFVDYEIYYDYDNRRFMQKNIKKDIIKNCNWILNVIEEVGKEFLEFSKTLKRKNFKKLSNKELIELFKKFLYYYERFFSLIDMRREIEPVLEEEFKKLLSDYTKDVESTFNKLVICEKETEIIKYKKKNLEIAAIFKKNGFTDEVKKLIKNHAEEYVWTTTTFLVGEILTEEKIIEIIKNEKNPEKRLKEMNENRKKEVEESDKLIEELGLKDNELLRTTRRTIYVINRRPEIFFESLTNCRGLLTEIGKRMNLSYEEVIQFKGDEIIKYLKTGTIVDKKEIEKRNKSNTVIMENYKIKFYFGDDSLKFKQEEKKIDVSEVKGQIACVGKAKGKAFVLLRKEDLSKIKKGMILVTPMTTPDLMPAIELSSAIVTDIGGMTTHAAIISRELNKPCIVGTKIATKVFKDGDLIEVDANKGIVRKIK